MSDPVNVAKLMAGGIAAGGAVPAAVDAIEKMERIVLGIPQSVLLVAVVGTLIGVLLLPEKDADRITPDDHLVGRIQRAQQMAVRIMALAIFVLAFALVAGWVVMLATWLWPSLAGAPQLPLAGISGVVIRKMLPQYVKLIERVTGAAGGKP